MEHLVTRVPHLPLDFRARSLLSADVRPDSRYGAIAGPVSDPSGALVARAVTVVKSQATLELRDLATDAWGGGRARSTAEAGWCRWREGALS